ncbi:uncharacterized protein TNCV_2103111 [Trichonephila clavipes]|nr:uncharacterized protein TNCV_2103111 [Trichonephila clavipes]
MTGTLPPLLDSMVGGGTPERSCVRVFMDPMLPCPGGEPKLVKRLPSGDLLIETISALQTKSFFLAKTFLDSSLTISPHKSLNTFCGVISEPGLLSTPEAEILDGFSDQGVIQVRRITIKKDNTIIPTKHLILTFNSPKLPSTIKTGYLNCKIRPYIPNPLSCFKCQSFHIVFYHSGKLLAFRISAIIPTTQIESRLPESISASAAAPDNSLNTSTSSLSTETCPAPTTSNKFAALQSSVPLSESATTTSNSKLSNTSKVPQNVKQNSKNRRKRTKAQKAEIEIKMA